MRVNITLTLFFASLLVGCVARIVERENIAPESFQKSSTSQINQLKVSSPLLKAHMKNGNLYVFDSWETDDAKLTISGRATLYSATRELIGKDLFTVGLDSTALLETNAIKNSGSATAMTVFTGITAAVTIFCISNPKACFGSCPTFYVSDGDSLRLQAEGFSSSISPALEATDIDALYHAQPSGGELHVEMRNEALETHVVRHVDVLAVPRHKDTRVFAGPDQQFWRTSTVLPPFSATSPEGDCLPLLLQTDGQERFSFADSSYLGAKEEINLEFKVQAGRSYGLAIGSRQTLLSTYLFYHSLAYAGKDAGHWLAEIERRNVDFNAVIERSIGGIEVLVYSPDEQWRLVGVINEHGPLASDIHLIPVGVLSSPNSKIKLRMAKGGWRLDYVALAELTEPVAPARVHPYSVLRDGQVDSTARSILLDPARVLVTLPGDTYTLRYQLPDADADYEFFLESRGYYLEWIRKEWIEEENPLLLAEMFLAPERALRRLAPEFKRVEAQLEESFWRSRYAKP